MSDAYFELDGASEETVPCVIDYWPGKAGPPTAEQLAGGECHRLVFHLRRLTLGDEEKIVNASHRSGRTLAPAPGTSVLEKIVRSVVSVDGLKVHGAPVQKLTRETAAKLPSWIGDKLLDAINGLNESDEADQGN